MRMCPYCGKPVDDSAPFCMNCGASLSSAPAGQQPDGQQPTYGQQQPTYGQQQPTYGQQQPTYGQQQPTYGQQQPTYGQQQPTYGQQQPTYGQQQPTYGQQQPAYGQQQPTYGQQQPAYGQQQPTYGQQQPTYGQQQPTYGQQQPAYGQQQVYSSKQPSGKKSKAPLIIGIVAGVAAVVALVVVALKVFNKSPSTPAEQFVAYQQDLFMSDFLAGLESGVDRFSSGSFSTDLTISLSVDDPTVNAVFANSSIKLGIDMGKNSTILGGELVLMGSPILSGTFTYEDGKLGFILPQADNTYYVMDLEKVVKNFTGQTINLAALQQSNLSGKQLRSLLEAYLDVVYATITEDNVTVEKDKTVSLPGLGDNFTGTVYTFKPTADDVEKMVIRLADRLENDKDLRDIITQMIAPLASLAASYDSGYGAQMEYELNRALQQAASELRREAAYIGRTVEQSGFTWTMAVEDKNVRKIAISAQNGSATIVYEAKGTAASGRTELLYVTSYGGRQDVMRRTLTQKGKECEGNMTLTLGGGYRYDWNIDEYRYYENSMSVSYKYDSGKKSVFGIPYGEYNVSLSSNGENIAFDMKVAAGANGGVDHILSIDLGEEYAYYNGFSKINMTVNATDRSTVTKPSQIPVDISNYSEDEFYQLFYNIGYSLGNGLVGNFPDLFGYGGGYGGDSYPSYGW